MNRKKLLLFILLILLVLSVGYGYWRMPRDKTVEKLKYTQGSIPAGKPVRDPGTDEKKLHLELLESSSKIAFSGFRRNIFRPIFHEEMKVLNLPPPPPPPPPRAPVPQPAMPPPAPPGTPEAPEPPAYVKEMGSFTFLGFMKKDNRKTIFLSKNNDIFVVKKGDLIANKYKVTNITDEALTINSVADGNEMIIPLEENKALNPAKK